MAYRTYLDFQDSNGFIDISNYVKFDSLEIIVRACSDNFHYAQNEARFQMIYESALYNKLKSTTQDILVKIVDVYYIGTEDNFVLSTEDDFMLMEETGGLAPIFYGRITPNKSRRYNGKIDNILWQIEAVDDMKLLDKKVGDVCWRNYKIMSPTSKATSIVHQLAYLAGLNDNQINQNMTIDKTLNAFSPATPEDSILDVLDTLLFEYGYTLNFNSAGQISPIKWREDTIVPVAEFNDSNILREVDIRDSVKNYEGCEVTYYELAEASTTTGDKEILLYRDTNLPYAENGGFSGYPIPSGYFYPPAANVIDPSTSGYQVVYQEYDDSALKYWTNEAIVNKLDYNYKAFGSNYSDIVATSGWRLDWSGDSSVTLEELEFYNRKARVVFKSSSGSNNKLYYANVYAKVLYKSAEIKIAHSTVPSSTKLDKYVSTFVFEESEADALSLALTKVYQSGNLIFTFKSLDDVSSGSFVDVVLNEGTDSKGFVVEKRWDNREELWEYVVRSMSL